LKLWRGGAPPAAAPESSNSSKKMNFNRCSSFILHFSRKILEREGEENRFRKRKEEIEMKKTGLHSFISKNEPVRLTQTGLVPFGSLPFLLNPHISIPFDQTVVFCFLLNPVYACLLHNCGTPGLGCWI